MMQQIVSDRIHLRANAGMYIYTSEIVSEHAQRGFPFIVWSAGTAQKSQNEGR